RAAALAEDILGAREADDVVDGQEIGRVAELTNELELVPDRLFDGGRIAAGCSRNSRAISSGAFRCRSALHSSKRPALSMVTCSRMQVITSISARRDGA